MAFERREPLNPGTELTLNKSDGGRLKLTIERVICYGERSIVYIGKICSTEISFAKGIVLKEFYPVSESDHGIHRDLASGRLMLADENRKKDFISKGREVFEGVFPFTGVAEENNTIYTYTNVNEMITLREWKEEGGQLTRKDIVRIMSSVCEYIRKVHERGMLYLNCNPESIYLIRGEGSVPGEAYMFDFDAVKRRNNADYRYHSYMDGWAPIEQVRKEKRCIDVQADVYAAGAVFLWMLTGEKVNIESDHDDVNGLFLWNHFSKLIEDSDTNVRFIKKILMNSLHNAWSARYINIAAMKKDFDKLARKYVKEEDIKAGTESVIYKDDANETEGCELKAEEKEYFNNKEDNIAYTDTWNNRHYYPNGIHSEDYPSGDHYEGEWNNGKFHGNGMYQWKNGDVYDGSWVNGLRNGHGQFKYANGNVYEGEFLNGQRSGKGKLIYAGGAIYEGDWVDNKATGNGKLTYTSGNVYEGEWVNAQRSGRGKLIYANGDVYEGGWLNDKKEGKGSYIYANGDVYEGGWLNDKKEGKGKYVYANGDVYEGGWLNDKKEGKGSYIYANGDVYEGGWLKDQKEGKGKYVYVNGDIYEGEYKEGKRNGHGRMIYKTGEVRSEEWENGKKKLLLQDETNIIKVKKIYNADGSFYRGETLNGVPHGKGKYIYTNGDIYEGEFNAGKRCGHGKYIKRTGEICEGEWINDKIHYVQIY